MQTQWSTGANDGNGGVGVGGGPMPVGSESVSDDSAGEAAGEAIGILVAAAPVDGSAAGDAGSDDVLDRAPADGGEGEEEAHRSAVDAVDGLLDEVERALARLDDGTYGRCEECGAPIDDSRLADSPIERTCGTCVIGGSGGLDAVTGSPGDIDAVTSSPGDFDVVRAPVAPVGLSAATGHHGV